MKKNLFALPAVVFSLFLMGCPSPSAFIDGLTPDYKETGEKTSDYVSLVMQQKVVKFSPVMLADTAGWFHGVPDSVNGRIRFSNLRTLSREKTNFEAFERVTLDVIAKENKFVFTKTESEIIFLKNFKEVFIVVYFFKQQKKGVFFKFGNQEKTGLVLESSFVFTW